MKSEAMSKYVIRKLSNRAYNLAEVARLTGIPRVTLSFLVSKPNLKPTHDTIEKLYNCFKDLAK